MFCIVAMFGCSPVQRDDGYIYYRLIANPSTLDPALITDVSASTVAAKLYNGLVRLNGDLEVIPDIAGRWTLSKDGLRYRFVLRSDVSFPDGRAVQAGDVLYSFQRVLHPQTRSPNAWIFQHVLGADDYRNGKAITVSGLRVIDEHTFEIMLKQPFTPFIRMLTMTPAFIVQREVVEKLGAAFAYEPSGTGPFQLKLWKPDREVVLVRKEHYFGGAAKIQGIAYRIIPEDLTALTEFEIGNLDIVALPASAYKKITNTTRWREHIHTLQGMNTYYLGMNCSRLPMSDVRLRHAVSLAIDRKKILETFYEQRGRLASGPVVDMLRQWQLHGQAQRYDAEAARSLVRSIGAEGTMIKLLVTADQEIADLAEIVQSYLKAAGLQVQIKQLEWSAYKAALNQGEADIFWLSWWADYPDAENFLFPLFHSANHGPSGNRTRYVNHTVDRLIEQGQAAFAEYERNEAYRKAEELIVQDAPWVFMWHKNEYVVQQPWIQGFRVYPVYTIDKGLEIAIRK